MSAAAPAEHRARRIVVARGDVRADRMEAEAEAPGRSIAARS